MRFLTWFLIALLIITVQQSLKAQIIEKGTPRFLDETKLEVPVIIMPGFNQKALLKEEKSQAQSRSKVLQYAKLFDVDINPGNDGVWKNLETGDKIWYIKIKSPEAFSIGVLFDKFRLPVGAKMFIYSANKQHIRGAFTFKNNKWNNILPVAPIKGDEIVIEYFEPAGTEFKGELNISSIAHDYKNVFSYISKSSKGIGDSGECNVNINCEEGDDWQAIKHSVCKIIYNGYLCSGTLINNTENDGHPYVLTANHCINNSFDANAAVFYFNYESSDCSNQEVKTDQTVSSSAIIAAPPTNTLDYTLLELSVNPPSFYEPFFAGWNRDVVDPPIVTTIHHPRGDIKKIAISNTGATTGNYEDTELDYIDFTHWWVKSWDVGTTEKGSSGSPLFDQNGKIIGGLSGGDASCTYNFDDYYQQFYHSWENYSNEGKGLKEWLDPINSGVITLNGFLPYDTIPTYLRASISDTVINLTWNEPVDTANVDYYYIYRNFIKIDSTENTCYSDTTANKNVVYKYWVTAKQLLPANYESDSSNVIHIRTMDPLLLPFVENFEDQFSIPGYWYEERSNESAGWEFKTGGLDGVLDTAYEGEVNAYFKNDFGESSKLVLPRFDLSTKKNVLLSFYLNMQEFNNDIHELRVLYKEKDSLEWKLIRSFKSDVPEWQQLNIPLPDLSDNYQIAIEGVGLKGYGICIDSITIMEDGKFFEPEIYIDNDTVCLIDTVEYSTNIDNSHELYWDFGETANPKSAIGIGPHKVNYSTPGLKPVELIVDNTYIKQSFDIAIVHNLPANPSFTIIGDQLTSNYEYRNQWYLNDILIENATGQTYTIEEDGNYYLEVTNPFNCTAVSESQYLVASDIDDMSQLTTNKGRVSIYPNPNKGEFTIQLDLKNNESQFNYNLIDITGRKIQSSIIELFEKEKKIIVNNPKDGIYILHISNSDSYYISKLIIKR